MDKELYLHIGLPKTGTTTLQQHVLSNNDQYLYVGKRPRYSENVNKEITAWRQRLKRNLIIKDLRYFAGFQDTVEELEQTLESSEKNKTKWLISDEGILSRSLSPHEYGNLVFAESAYEITRKLAEVRKNDIPVRVIIVIRRQVDFLHSLLAQNFRLLRTYLKISTMEDLLDYLEGPGAGGTADSLLNYSSFVEHCDSVLGRENVLVLPFELMVKCPEEFLQMWADFMGIYTMGDPGLINGNRENQRKVSTHEKQVRTKSAYVLLRAIKRSIFGETSFGLRDRFKFAKNISRKRTINMTRMDQTRIMSLYASSNEKLEGRVHRIEEFDYW